MVCDLCAKKGSTSKARIEGVVYDVCSECASLGSSVKEKKVSKKRGPRPDPDADVVLRSDFSSRLRKARGSVKHEDFAKRLRVKESDLHAWETNQRVPTIDTAKRLQKTLNTSLVTKQVSDDVSEASYSSSGSSGPLTIADLLKKK